MVTHVLPADLPLREGETPEAYMRRIAREKPPTHVPTKPCVYCGADHLFSAAYWPAEERAIHNQAKENYEEH